MIDIDAIKKLYKKTIEDGYTEIEEINQWTDDYFTVKLRKKDNRDKKVLPISIDENGKLKAGRPKFEDGEMPLYGRESLKDGKACFVVEGEGCVNALKALDIGAVTCGASGNVSKCNWSILKDKHVIIWPDNDDPGHRMADEVITTLQEIASKVEVIDVEAIGLEKKADCVDWIKSKGDVSKQDIANLPKSSKKCHLTIGGFVYLTFDDIVTLDVKPPRFLLGDWLTESSLNLIYAHTGVGKTWMALGIATAISTGGEFLGWTSKYKHGVLYYDGEMSAFRMLNRIRGILDAISYTDNPNLFLYTPQMQKLDTVNLADEACQKAITKALGKLKDVKVIIFDNISCLVQSDKGENEAESWQGVKHFAIKLRNMGYAVIFIHHANKSGDQRGSNAKLDQLDYSLELKKLSTDEEKTLCFQVNFKKNRHSEGDIPPLEVKLITEDGKYRWIRESGSESNYERFKALYELEDDPKARMIAKELGLAHTTVNRYIKKYKGIEELPAPKRKRSFAKMDIFNQPQENEFNPELAEDIIGDLTLFDKNSK